MSTYKEKKQRIPVPKDIASDLLYQCDRTCCVCAFKGKQVQIHHIDDDPSNNNLDNLTTLCFDCHNDTQVQGGFGRKLDKDQINKYRYEWIRRVKERRVNADKLASIKSVTGIAVSNQKVSNEETYYETSNDPDQLRAYIMGILDIKTGHLMVAEANWDSGAHIKMNKGSSLIIDFYQKVLVELARFYPLGHFNNQDPDKIFSNLIYDRLQWHERIQEPKGPRSRGRIVDQIIDGKVMEELSNMILEMVDILIEDYNLNINWSEWVAKWKK